MENKNLMTVESKKHSDSKLSKKQKFELLKIPKISEGLFNAIASLSILTGSVLSAQSAFAEMKTGAIMDTEHKIGFGSSLQFFDKKNECIVTNEHVVPKSSNDVKKTEYYNIPHNPFLNDQTILDDSFLPKYNAFDKYPGQFVIYPKLFDAAVVSNPNKPCTREFLVNQIGIDNILTVEELYKRNLTQFKDQSIRVTTHRNRDTKEMFDNKSHTINGKPIGITIMFYNQVVFLNFANAGDNNGIDPNQFLLQGASGSPSYTKHKDGKETIGLINTVFPMKDLNNIIFIETGPNTYTFVKLQEQIEFIKLNPQFRYKKALLAEDIILGRLKELGYTNKEEFVGKKSLVFGITPFFSKEGLDQIPSEKDLQQIPNTPITKK
jgi:hypothetical protein